MKPVTSFLLIPAVLAAVASAGPVSKSLRASCDSERTPRPKPTDRVDCQLANADTDQGPWSECKDDGSNKWYKTTVLGIKVPAQNGGKPCPAETSPERIVKKLCEAVPCVLAPADTDKTPFGECKKDEKENKWYQTKLLPITKQAQHGGKCDEKDRTVRQECTPGTPGKPVDCEWVPEKDDKTPFGECKKDEKENKWYQTKLLLVTKQAQNGGKCDEKDRTVRQECTPGTPGKPVDCEWVPEKDDKTPFGECKKDEKENKWYQTKLLLVTKQAQNGGKCDEKDRTVRQECTPGTPGKPVDCTWLTEAEDKAPFGECKVDNKGKWYQTKLLTITKQAENGGKCDDEARTARKECKAVDCEAYTKDTDPGPFTPCKDDGTGKFWKEKTLGIKTPAQYGGAACLSEDKRKHKELCVAVDCTWLTEAEDKAPFGECKVDNKGKWYQTKLLTITKQAENGGKCDDEARTARKECKAVDCEAYTKDTDPGPFTPCKDDGTGKFWKEKTLGIKTPAQYGGAACLPEDKRKHKELCVAVDCTWLTEAEDKAPFGECKVDNKGKWYQTKLLTITKQAENGGKCDDEARTARKECKAVDCEAYTKDTDPGPFTPCKDDGTGKFWKEKTLGIKTPAQYGGAACLPEDKRKHKELCVAVDCTWLTEAEDKAPFGECKVDNKGKWYQTKLLTITKQAENGGKCDDAARTARKECPAVDCVTDAATAAWGKCTDSNPANKFTRTKTVTIISQPLYGGKACPKNSELTVTESCPQEDYCVSPDSFYDTCVKQLAQCGDKIKDKLFIGSEIQLFKGIQLYQCCDKCAHTLGCAGYSFKPAKDANPSECSLKSQADKSNMSYNNGAISSKVKK